MGSSENASIAFKPRNQIEWLFCVKLEWVGFFWLVSLGFSFSHSFF